MHDAVVFQTSDYYMSLALVGNKVNQWIRIRNIFQFFFRFDLICDLYEN